MNIYLSPCYSKPGKLDMSFVVVMTLLLTGCWGGGSGAPTSTTLTGITITPATKTIANGQIAKFTATGSYSDSSIANITGQVSWKSDNIKIATIDSATGVATGVEVGSTTVTASVNGITSPAAKLSVTSAVITGLTISPITPSVPAGRPVTFSATAKYSDGSSSNVSELAKWSSSNTAVAKLRANGIAASFAKGSTIVTASVNGVSSNRATFTVTSPVLASITISPSSPKLMVGYTQLFSASGLLSDGSIAALTKLTWKSSNTAIATIDHAGLARMLKIGSSHISASSGGITSNSALLSTPASPIGVFRATGNMATSRNRHTATLLTNGKVLVTGGYDGTNTFASAELYDPASGNFISAGKMTTARAFHTATLMSDGKVLVTGGNDGISNLASAEIYNPETGNFVATGNMSTPRSSHTATLLTNGKVLITGTWTTSGSLATAEIYDPVTGNFVATGSMSTPRNSHAATLLSNGKVLVTGRIYGVSPFAEIYDPATGKFNATGNMVSAKYSHTATLLSNGKVLIAGGKNGGAYDSAEIYDPEAGSFVVTGSMSTPRNAHTATLLPDGRVLVTGGGVASAEIFDPKSDNFSATGSMSAARIYHTATLLSNGQVLVTGAGLPNAELFH